MSAGRPGGAGEPARIDGVLSQALAIAVLGAAPPFADGAGECVHLARMADGGESAGEPDKKRAWRDEKRARRDVRLTDAHLRQARAAAVRPAASAPLPAAPPPPGSRVEPITTLHYVWTRETMPLLPGPLPERGFSSFLRDHFTNQPTDMDARLLDVLARVGSNFRAPRIDVVSGYRSPKYNLTLRKKGREVARGSQHTEGAAVDFRLPGVPTKQVQRYVRSLRAGGVGYYPQSNFVHADTGPVRAWTGK